MAKVDGIDQDSIDTDTGKRVVSFKVKSSIDLDEALAAHAPDTHLEDWSRVKN